MFVQTEVFVHRKRGSPSWLVVALILALLMVFSGCGLAHAGPAVSGEFGVLQQVTRPADRDFAWFGGECWFAPHARPTELFGNLRIGGGHGSAALCIEGRHTIAKRDWLAWEDRIGARMELPLSSCLTAIAGWEQRYRIGDGRCVVGVKIALGRSPKD